MKIETSKKNIEILSIDGINTMADTYGFDNHVKAFERMEKPKKDFYFFTKEETEKFGNLIDKGCTKCIPILECFSWSNYKQTKTSECCQLIAVKEKEKYTEEGSEIIEIFTIYWNW